MTDYIVITLPALTANTTSPSRPLPITKVSAASANAAIRAVAEKNGDGEYVAVPARSWKPMKVTVSTVKQVKLA